MKQWLILILFFAFSEARAEIQAVGMTCKTASILQEIKSKQTATISSETLIAQRSWKNERGTYSLSYYFQNEVTGVDQVPVLATSIETVRILENGLKLRGFESRGLFVNKKGIVTDYSAAKSESMSEQTGPQEWASWSVKDGQKNEILSRTIYENLEGGRRKVSTKDVKLSTDANIRTVSNESECFVSSLSQQDFEALAHDSQMTQDLAQLDRLFLKSELDKKTESFADFERAWSAIYSARKKRLEKVYAKAVERNRGRQQSQKHSIRQPYERTSAEQNAACAIWRRNTLGMSPTPSCP